MRKRQKTLNVPEHELIQDVATRWNSTQMMLECLCEQRRVVTDILLDPSFTKKNDSALLLSNIEWDIISELSVVLKDLTKVTTYRNYQSLTKTQRKKVTRYRSCRREPRYGH